MTDQKPVLSLDFDGVLHSCTSGRTSPTDIADAPVPGAIQFLVEASEDFQLMIFSSRSRQPGGVAAMAAWLIRHGLPKGMIAPAILAELGTTCHARDIRFDAPIAFPLEKPSAHVTLDDRAIQFTGAWPDIDALRDFEPWTNNPFQAPDMNGISAGISPVRQDLEDRLTRALAPYVKDLDRDVARLAAAAAMKELEAG